MDRAPLQQIDTAILKDNYPLNLGKALGTN